MRPSRARAERLEAALAEVEQLDLEGLRTRWQALHGGAAPTSFRVTLLRAAVAYTLQERALGGLKPSTRTLLRRIAEQADRHRRSAGSVTADAVTLGTLPAAGSGAGQLGTASAMDAVDPVTASSRPRRPAIRIKPGTRLLRTWQGATHEVLVGPGEVIYQGRRYRSLSEVARLITGQRWSGPLFFGLKGPAAAATTEPKRQGKGGQGT